MEPLAVQITLPSGKRPKFQASIRVPIGAWDARAQALTGKVENAKLLAGRVHTLQTKTEKFLLENERLGVPFDAEAFRVVVLDKKPKVFVRAENSYKSWSRRYVNEHEMGYSQMRRHMHIVQIIEDLWPGIEVREIDITKLTDFFRHVQSKATGLGNEKNTAIKKIQALKAVLHYAAAFDVKADASIALFKSATSDGLTNFLTLEELAEVDALQHDTRLIRTEYTALRSFLFACYTGLRYSDVWARHRQPGHGVHNGQLQLIQKKTKEAVYVPLNEKAKELLAGGVLDRVYSNDKTNQYLADALRHTSITRPVTFHCARHTFGTASLTLGIPVEVLQRLMGHEKLSTTMRYARIVDSLKISSMKKWDVLFKAMLPAPAEDEIIDLFDLVSGKKTV
jgi:integrase